MCTTHQYWRVVTTLPERRGRMAPTWSACSAQTIAAPTLLTTSRAISTPSCHRGRPWTHTSVVSTVTMKRRSHTGSSTTPILVCCPSFFAAQPSSQSEMPATHRIATAIRGFVA
jgi:hypothetical protein